MNEVLRFIDFITESIFGESFTYLARRTVCLAIMITIAVCACLFLFWVFASCTPDEDPVSPPPATQSHRGIGSPIHGFWRAMDIHHRRATAWLHGQVTTCSPSTRIAGISPKLRLNASLPRPQACGRLSGQSS
jgi:hypothetical protein